MSYKHLPTMQAKDEDLKNINEEEIRIRKATVDPSSSLLDIPSNGSESTKQPTALLTFQRRWLRSLLRHLSKLKSKRTWVAVMFVFGTLDVGVNLFRLVHTTSSAPNESAYMVIIGAESSYNWIPLCFFTIVGTVLYVPETANTFSSLMSSNGETFIPLHLELITIMMLEHIPLASVDFFIGRCWSQSMSYTATVCNMIRISFIFCRILWFAHIEGKKLRKNDKHEIPQVIVMVCCMLFAVCVTFPIMNWRTKIKIDLEHQLNGVSVFLVWTNVSDDPILPEQRYTNSFYCAIAMCSNEKTYRDKCHGSVDLMSFTQNRSDRLVPSLTSVYNKRDDSNGWKSIYECKKENNDDPLECYSSSSSSSSSSSFSSCFLYFQFVYSNPKKSYGKVSYNFARVCKDDKKEMFCEKMASRLSSGWSVVYYSSHSRSFCYNVSVAFKDAFIQPTIKYDPQITVCSSNNETFVKPKSYSQCNEW